MGEHGPRCVLSLESVVWRRKRGLSQLSVVEIQEPTALLMNYTNLDK